MIADRDFLFFGEVMIMKVGFIGAGKVGTAFGLFLKQYSNNLTPIL